jgi:hypothetical protein
MLWNVIVYPCEKFPICPSFSELQEQRFDLTATAQLDIKFFP